MDQLLHLWGLSEYTKKFQDQQVDLDCLLLLKDEDIDKLIDTVGKRAVFRAKLEAYKEILNNVNQQQEPSLQVVHVEPLQPSTNERILLQDLGNLNDIDVSFKDLSGSNNIISGAATDQGFKDLSGSNNIISGAATDQGFKDLSGPNNIIPGAATDPDNTSDSDDSAVLELIGKSKRPKDSSKKEETALTNDNNKQSKDSSKEESHNGLASTAGKKSLSCPPVVINNSPGAINSVDIVGILNTTHQGKRLLKDFQNCKDELPPKKRKILYQSIGNYYFEKGYRLTRADCFVIAVNIPKIFPGENDEVYANRNGKNNGAGGKLINYVNNQCRSLIPDGSVARSRKPKTEFSKNKSNQKSGGDTDSSGESTSSQAATQNTKNNGTTQEAQLQENNPQAELNEASTSAGSNDINSEKVLLGHKSWLSSCHEPWKEVEHRWQASFSLRKAFQTDDSLNITRIFEEWPILMNRNGHELIKSDFGQLYPNNQDNLYIYWNDFVKNVIKAADDRKGRNKNIEALINEYNSDDIAEGAKEVIIFELISYLIPPTGCAKKQSELDDTEPPKKKGRPKGKGKAGTGVWKYSIPDSKESFLDFIDNSNDINRKYEEKVNYLKQHGLNVQPWIIVVGTANDPPRAVYVKVSDATYYFDNLKQALDTCYKIHFVLNLKYCEPCYNVWLLIQRFLYQMRTDNDNVSSRFGEIEKYFQN